MISVLVRMKYGRMGIGFTQQKNDNFFDGGKATQRSLPDNLTQRIISKSRDFTGKGIGKVSRSVQAYVYSVLTSQGKARLSIVGN